MSRKGPPQRFAERLRSSHSFVSNTLEKHIACDTIQRHRFFPDRPPRYYATGSGVTGHAHLLQEHIIGDACRQQNPRDITRACEFLTCVAPDIFVRLNVDVHRKPAYAANIIRV